MKRFFNFVGFLGFLLLLGTAGASDMNTVSFVSILMLGITGVSLLLLGYYGSISCRRRKHRTKDVRCATVDRLYGQGEKTA